MNKEMLEKLAVLNEKFADLYEGLANLVEKSTTEKVVPLWVAEHFRKLTPLTDGAFNALKEYSDLILSNSNG